MDPHFPFRPDDLTQLTTRGIPVETVQAQIAMFKRGLPFITLQRPCTVGDGITVLSRADLERYIMSHARVAELGRIMKFVPASGAATRMFQLLLSVANRTSALSEEQIATAALSGDSEYQAARQFVGNLPLFAFYDDLRSVMARAGFTID